MEIPKILLVDDDADDQTIILDALQQLHPANMVRCADNGEMAIRLLEEYAAAGNFPCLVVLDLNMPKMNGTDTLRNLRKDVRFKNIDVVIYSTSINPKEQEACMKLGAQFYITKPVSYRESLDTARFFLNLCKVPAFA
jgi:CheY-like chemotaxis protein